MRVILARREDCIPELSLVWGIQSCLLLIPDAEAYAQRKVGIVFLFQIQPGRIGPAVSLRLLSLFPPKGNLAVIVPHTAPSEGVNDNEGRPSKTWVFCPDALCLDCKPKGSNLPPW